MAENTITAILPDIYEALDVVSRELAGMIPSVTMAASAERAAKDQNILVDVAPVVAGADATPAMVVPDPTGLTSVPVTMTINKERAFAFGFNGNDAKGLNTGVGYLNHRAGKVAQAIRACVNEIEVDLAALYTTFSRAYGTAGTTPFATANDYTDSSLVQKILKDNGAPPSDNSLVLNTTAGANFLGKQSAVNSAGTDSMLRQGVLLDVHGMPLRESAQVNTHVNGTGTGYLLDDASSAIGDTSLVLDTGSGTVLAGDVVTFAGDTNKYLVTTGVAAPGTIVIAAPGLKVALADSAAMTIGADYAANMCFSRSAIVLLARAPALPEEGDMADDRQIITDPRSGLSLEIAMYKGYRKVRYEIGAAWGVDNIKPEHTAILLG